MSVSPDEFPASAYLRGREVAVRLRPVGGEGEPVDNWLSLSNLHVARLEEQFGGQTAFDKAFEDSPQSTLRTFIAIALGSEVPVPVATLDAVSARMVQQEWPAYMAFLETAWLLAHGGNEDDAGKVFSGKVTLALSGTSLTVAITQEAVRITTESRGVNGSKRGRVSVGPSKSSGK